MSDLRVVATIVAKPESVQPVREALAELGAASRDEEGCLGYELFESAAAPGTFVTVETWTGQEALDQHMQSAHIGKALTVTDGQLAEPPAIHPLVAVS